MDHGPGSSSQRRHSHGMMQGEVNLALGLEHLDVHAALSLVSQSYSDTFVDC
jgi:hypothetical protein